jgi:hypothetical protein
MTRIMIRSVSVDTPQGNASGYEWTVTEGEAVVGHAVAPTIIEAAMAAGNLVYDRWGYAESMGRLAVVGYEPTIVDIEGIGSKNE